MKLYPVIVIVKALPPSVAEPGLRETIAGTGFEGGGGGGAPLPEPPDPPPQPTENSKNTKEINARELRIAIAFKLPVRNICWPALQHQRHSGIGVYTPRGIIIAPNR